MYRMHKVTYWLRRIKHLSFFLLLVSLTFLILSCTQTRKPYYIVEFRGDDMVANYSKGSLMSEYQSDSSYTNALLAEKGDLFVTSRNYLLVYNEPFRNKYDIKTTKQACYANGKLISITIPGNDSMIVWIEQLRKSDIQTLDFIYFDSKISESYFPCLAAVAKMKPDIGLGYVGKLSDMAGLFKIFKPGLVFTGSVPENDYNILAGLADLEILSLSLNDSINYKPLPAMPKLKMLILPETDSHISIRDLLINNKQIEKLNIVYARKIDLSVITPLVNLKELIISQFDTIENFELIKNHKQLEVLSLNGKKVRFDEAMNELTNIRWMAFYQGATQEEFNGFIEHHPELEVVDIIKNESISDLHPLLTLKNIYGLTVADSLTDFQTLKSLKSLAFLSLPDVVLNDSIKKAELQKSLPDTKLVATHGVCLGSGWLLLIIPFVLLFRTIRMRTLPVRNRS